MVYGFGRGTGGRGGAGFGFRGASPPWPYAGRGRGGLPRCSYPGINALPGNMPFSQPYSAQMTQEGDISWLKSQAEAIKTELDRVESRIRDIEADK